MTEDTLFSKIIRRELPADIVFQDERVTAFRDINPQAPTHLLIVPNKVIPTVNDISAEDEGVLGHMFVVAKQLAAQEGVAEDVDSSLVQLKTPNFQVGDFRCG